MSEELSPCPFCGGELMFCPSHVEGQYIINKPGGVCKKCGMMFVGRGYRIYGEAKSEDFNNEKFFERWNRRPAEDALKAEVGRLRESLKTIVQNSEFWDDEDDSLAIIHKVAGEALTVTEDNGVAGIS